MSADQCSLFDALKKCTKCGQALPATPEFFHRSKAVSQGLSARCKACDNAKNREQNRRNTTNAGNAQAKPKEALTEKRCPACEQTKPVEEFYISRAKADGRYHCCKPCARSKVAAQRRANIEESLEKEAAKREANRERNRRVNQAYKERNREAIQEASRRYYQENKEQHLEATRRWAKNNREAAREYVRKRRAARRNATGEHTADDVLDMYDSQDGLCCWCETPLFGDFHVDHLTPLSRGGGDGVENLAIACESCNCSKNARTAVEYWEYLRSRGAVLCLSPLEL